MQQPLRPSAFDSVPAIYDRARPLYPSALFDDFFAYLRESRSERECPHPEIVEVGAGTGQATGVLLERGAHVTAVELGPSLAAFLAEKHRANANLRVIAGAFEQEPTEEGRWDAVLSATAYHWVKPEARLARPGALLVPGGVLAVIDTNQVESDADRGFFVRCQPIYNKYQPPPPSTPQGLTLDVVPPIFNEMQASDLFEDVRLWRYRWDQKYDGAQYADLLLSYSNTQDMDPEPRAGLVADLRAMVEAEEGGYVVRPLVITLAVGRRRAS